MNTKLFYQAPKDLLSCHAFVSPVTGESIEMKSTDKLILIYMLDRTTMFNKNGGRHYETQSTIGDGVGVEWKAAARSLKRFVQHGVIAAVKERNLSISPHLCYYYKSVNTSVELVGKSSPEKENKSVDKHDEPDMIDEIEYDEAFLASINFGD